MATIERALQIAASAHAGQTDKEGQPYILHPLRVMMGADTDCVTSGIVCICGVPFPENEVQVGASPKALPPRSREWGVIGPGIERRNSECTRPLRAVAVQKLCFQPIPIPWLSGLPSFQA